jgi:hypothetical protein
LSIETTEALPSEPAAAPAAHRLRRHRRLSDRAWWLLAAVMLAWGLRLALLPQHGIAKYPWAARAVMLLPLLALVPPVARGVTAGIGRVRRMPRAALGWVALALAVGAMSYLYLSAVHQGVRLVPTVKDEYSYLLQARMLSTGRLWLPRHPLADFFETTAVITDRVYASVYPPGTALLLAPGAALDWPHWVIPMLLSGAAIAMTFRVVAALIDPWYGLAATLMMVGSGLMQVVWRYAMAQVPAMLFGLLIVWCFLRWARRKNRLRWAALLGAAAGWALIIRPQDAVCYLLPVAVAMLVAMWRRPRPVVAAALVAGRAASPFLALQAVANKGITGRWTDFPHNYYHRRDLPNLGYGFQDRHARDVKPASASPQKQMEFETERAGLRTLDARNRGDWLHLWNRRIPTLLEADLPDPFLAVFLPVGFLSLRRRYRWVLAASVILFLVVYLPWPFILEHYPLVVMPGVLLLVALGMHGIERHAGRWRTTVTALLAAIVVTSVAVALPEVNAAKRVGTLEVVTPADIDRLVRRFTDGRAVVLLRYDTLNGARMRPYNLDVANPDDAPVIKALDLGPRNHELFEYYQAREPDRSFFLYDFADYTLTPLSPPPATRPTAASAPAGGR